MSREPTKSWEAPPTIGSYPGVAAEGGATRDPGGIQEDSMEEGAVAKPFGERPKSRRRFRSERWRPLPPWSARPQAVLLRSSHTLRTADELSDRPGVPNGWSRGR